MIIVIFCLLLIFSQSDICGMYDKGDLYKLIISRKRAILPFLSLSCSEFSL